MDKVFEVGDEVGAGRWPCSSGHPDNWREPRRGEVLRADDPRAWPIVDEFGVRMTLDKIRQRVAATAELREGMVPVLWHFETEQVLWERCESLAPYEADVKAWVLARSAERASCGRLAVCP